MAVPVAGKTELDAVNLIFADSGRAQINDLTTSGPAAGIALRLLTEASREIQSSGWTFNTECNVTLARDVDGFLFIPVDILRVDADDASIRTVKRGDKLYDRENNTFVWKQDVKVTLVRLLTFVDLPETFKNWVTHAASVRYESTTVGSRPLGLRLQADLRIAQALALKEEIDTADVSIFGGTTRLIVGRSPLGGRVA